MTKFDPPEMIDTGQVARAFGVNPKTVTRWADEGRLRFIRTLGSNGGHRRYFRSDIEALLRGETPIGGA